jgi:hypothetical protein
MITSQKGKTLTIRHKDFNKLQGMVFAFFLREPAKNFLPVGQSPAFAEISLRRHSFDFLFQMVGSAVGAFGPH